MARLGILGTGWGLTVQVPRFREAGLTIQAIYSRSQERATAIAKEHDIPHGFSSVDDVCKSDDVDLVTCVGPTHTRCGQALAALRAGKHVLVDKPMALNVGEAEKMLAAARAAKTHAWMDFELRCTPAVVALREHLKGDDLGGILHISFRCLGNFSFLKSGATFSHWATRENGGGVYSAVGTHYTDLSRHLTGKEVRRVSATQRTLIDTLDDEDGKPQPVTCDGLTIASMELEEPAVEGKDTSLPLPVHMYIAGRNPGLEQMVNECVVACEKGTARIDFTTATLTVTFSAAAAAAAAGADPRKVVVEGSGSAWSHVGTPALGRAIGAVFQGKDLEAPAEPGGVAPKDLATLEDGVIVQRVTDAVHGSAARGGAWIEVDTSRP